MYCWQENSSSYIKVDKAVLASWVSFVRKHGFSLVFVFGQQYIVLHEY